MGEKNTKKYKSSGFQISSALRQTAKNNGVEKKITLITQHCKSTYFNLKKHSLRFEGKELWLNNGKLSFFSFIYEGERKIADYPKT